MSAFRPLFEARQTSAIMDTSPSLGFAAQWLAARNSGILEGDKKPCEC